MSRRVKNYLLKVLRILVACTMLVMLIPLVPEITMVAGAVVPTTGVLSYQWTLPNTCRSGYFSWGGPGTSVSCSTCEHGSYGTHYYDATTGFTDGGLTTVGTNSSTGYPTLSPSSQKTITMNSICVNNQSGYSITLSTPTVGTSTYIVKDNVCYARDNGGIPLTLRAAQHYPVYINYSSRTVLVDAYNTTVYVPAGTMTTITAAPVSGRVTLENDSYIATTSHAATKCDNSTYTLTISHTDKETRSGTVTYYDENGNVIGGTGYNYTYCNACNQVVSGSSGGHIQEGYEGDIYDENGNKVGSVTIDKDSVTSKEGTYTGTGAGAELAGYANGTRGGVAPAPSVEKSLDTCSRIVYTLCEAHEYYGVHYYCTTHNYCGLSDQCIYCRDTTDSLYKARAYGYTGSNSSIYVSPIVVTCPDATCIATTDYISAVQGATVTVTATAKPDKMKYTVKDARGNTVSAGETTNSSFTFSMPSTAATVTLEQARRPQKIIVASTINSSYNAMPFNLGATVGEAS